MRAFKLLAGFRIPGRENQFCTLVREGKYAYYDILHQSTIKKEYSFGPSGQHNLLFRVDGQTFMALAQVDLNRRATGEGAPGVGICVRGPIL